MRDWIVGYEKGAAQKSPGVGAEEWADAEGALGEAPEELRDFYRQMNGATFNSGVHVFPLRAKGAHRGLIEESRISAAGLPDSGIWRFGEKGSKHLFALRKADATALEGAPEHEWLSQGDESEWVYGVKDELTRVVKLYPSMENLLATLIPPAESEEFGERTYARAMTLVQSALDGLDESGSDAEQGSDEETEDEEGSDEALEDADEQTAADETDGHEVEAPARAASRPKAKPAKKAPGKKGPAKKAPAKKAPAKKAAKSAAKKAKPVKKAASKKTAAKKPAAKKAAKGKKVTKAPSKAARKAGPKAAARKGASKSKGKAPAKKKGRR